MMGAVSREIAFAPANDAVVVLNPKAHYITIHRFSSNTILKPCDSRLVQYEEGKWDE
jgi:hypothetical protein